VLCGGGEDRRGQTHEVRLDRDDHRHLKDDGGEYCRAEARERGMWERALARAVAADGRDRAAPRGDRDDHDR